MPIPTKKKSSIHHSEFIYIFLEKKVTGLFYKEENGRDAVNFSEFQPSLSLKMMKHSKHVQKTKQSIE
jgi:hypothetical protein